MENIVFNKEDIQFLATVEGMWVGGTPKSDDDMKNLKFGTLLAASGYSLKSKHYELTEKLLTLAEAKAKTVIDLHFCFNQWIDFTYKARGGISSFY